jgi:hypothetical protein
MRVQRERGGVRSPELFVGQPKVQLAQNTKYSARSFARSLVGNTVRP